MKFLRLKTVEPLRISTTHSNKDPFRPPALVEMGSYDRLVPLTVPPPVETTVLVVLPFESVKGWLGARGTDGSEHNSTDLDEAADAFDKLFLNRPVSPGPELDGLRIATFSVMPVPVRGAIIGVVTSDPLRMRTGSLGRLPAFGATSSVPDPELDEASDGASA